MNYTLIQGDRIIVNKLAYGARIPITPLSLDFIADHTFLDWIQLPYLRLPGYSKVQRNDIIIFNFPLTDSIPIDEKKEYVKRCIALPGDTLNINKGIVYVNNEKTEEEKLITFCYKMNHQGIVDSSIRAQLHYFDSTNMYSELFIPTVLVDSLKHVRNITSITRKIIDTNTYTPSIFPNAADIKWNLDNFGPLYIPEKGSKIILTKKNILLYKRIIEQYENNKLFITNDAFYINDKAVTSYIFKMNYYFVLGDNRYNSYDSRFLGFVPEDHLIGKTSFLFYSSNKFSFLKKSRTFSFLE